ncbi:hypothetical protein [Risungbinella massiliensis]|uniref:hypothetical protein n=1 Tax=Risungbinella massiliensis TaxID=1329796 RepID=UPI0005CB988B|nr:hypothetical protein [Risungbinella massiliensis]
MKTWPQIMKEAGLITLLSINLSLGAIILVRDYIPLQESVPSITGPVAPNLQTEYVMELVETKQEGDYRVETYQEFEIQYNENGQEVSKSPTDKKEYIPYYTGP